MSETTNKQTEKNGKGRISTGQFAKGNHGGPGRPMGSQNKVNALLKEDILQAYNELGGIEYLKKLEPGLLVRLMDKCIPREIAQDINVRGVELRTSITVIPREAARQIEHEKVKELEVLPLNKD